MEAAVKAASKTADFSKLLARMETCRSPQMQALCDQMGALLEAARHNLAACNAAQELSGVTLAVDCAVSANVESLEACLVLACMRHPQPWCVAPREMNTITTHQFSQLLGEVVTSDKKI
jgi:hypothetical protein